MNLAITATVFGIVFVAELPDKTALASLVLGTRYRASWAFIGTAVGFAMHVALALVAGRLLALLPHRVLESLISALFVIGAVLLLHQSRRPDDAAADGATADDATAESENEAAEAVDQPAAPTPAGATRASFWRAVITSFSVIAVAEFGDLTQIAIANLSARYDDPLAVGIGAVLALWAVAALAIIGGKGLLRLIPMRWVLRVAALVMLAMAGFSLTSAISG
jgi:putative Ca2+/H+ antiporter (TMEM165/GDT1 family)